MMFFLITFLIRHRVVLLLQTAVMMSKRGLNFIGVIKTAHALFPKDYIQQLLGPLPTSSRISLQANVDGEELYAVGYKYNRKKVLFFVCTAGVADLKDGEPYIQRWADDNGNLCTRDVPRPTVISRYFKDSPKVDNHNQARQHDLALEELWLTQDCWFRLHTTMHGIVATDCWKLVRYHLSINHFMKNITMNDFADVLAKRLIDNNLNNGTPSTTRSSAKRPRRANTPEEVPHKPVPMPRFNGKTKQLRCRWCSLFHNVYTSFTSFKCEDCNVGLCVASNRPGARNCFDLHRIASPADLCTITSTAKIRR